MSEDAARQIEAEVIGDMYKTTTERLQARREKFQALADEGGEEVGQKTDRYKSYMEDLRREYRSEKEEKVRNKSFEYDKSVRSQSEVAFNPQQSMGNILSGIREDDSKRRELDERPTGQETVSIRHEIRSRQAQGLAGANGSPRHGVEGHRMREFIQQQDEYGLTSAYDRSKQPALDLPRAQKRSGISEYQSTTQGLDALENRAENNVSEINPSSKERGGMGDYAKQSVDKLEFRDTRVHDRPRHMPPDEIEFKEYVAGEVFITSKSHESREFHARVGDKSGGIAQRIYQDRNPVNISSPLVKRTELEMTSSEKKLYNWNEEKQEEDKRRIDKDKSRDPFDDKTAADTGRYAYKDLSQEGSRPDTGRPPAPNRSASREEFNTTRADRIRSDLRDNCVDRMYLTERNQKRDNISRSPDLGPHPSSRETETAGLLGKCKRLESENQILLKNNSELRKENMILQEKSTNSRQISDLQEQIRDLMEKNRRLELQAMSQSSSPIIMAKTPNNHPTMFFDHNSKSRDRLNRTGVSQDKYGGNTESSKQLAFTERLQNGHGGADEKHKITKLKFADSVLGMLRQLIDLKSGDEECKHAWKILKNVMSEYVELKREARCGLSSPMLKKDISTNSDTIGLKSTGRSRQSSEDKNKWRDRTRPIECAYNGNGSPRLR